MTDYNPNHKGMREFLNSSAMVKLVGDAAEVIKIRAIALAPVGTIAEGDEHPGLYISSFRIRTHRFGGVNKDRAEAIVYNDAPDAVYVEYGHFGREPYHVMLRAAREAKMLWRH
jgi:hypothetical protein